MREPLPPPGSVAIQDLSAATKELLARHIDSVIQLEMLLMLKSESNVPRTSEQISQRLYVTERAAAEQLVRLCRGGFLDCHKDADGLEWYQYKPVNPRLRDQVQELARDYAERRVRLIEWLYSKPSSSVQSFAGAFRLRRSEDE